jgi:hypothetical protein
MPAPNGNDYRVFLEREWADFHHSRMQEWTALGVIIGIHFGIVQLLDLARSESSGRAPTEIVVAGALVGIVFAVLGSLVTCRHERLKKIKLNWIGRAEYFRGLMREKKGEPAMLSKGNPNPRIVPFRDGIWQDVPWRGLSVPAALSTSGLILAFYALLVLVDVSLAYIILLPPVP